MRYSNATPRNISPTSIISTGKYSAGTMIAKAIGNAASRPTAPRTSQVSLPSQKGEMDAIINSRSAVEGAARDRMPTPRSKPSSTTYIKMPTAMMVIQIRVK